MWVVGYYFLTETDIMMSLAKTHVIGCSHRHSQNECIEMCHYLLLFFHHHQQADLFSFHNYNVNEFLQSVTGLLKAKYRLHHLPIECLKCRNSKSNRPKLHTFGCNILASTQFMDLKLWEFISTVLDSHASLRYG